MGQEDFFLREIEKIGVLLRALINRLIHERENLAISPETAFRETAERLMSETGFDLKKFLKMNPTETDKYLSTFKGYNTENLELLADLLFRSGISEKPERMKVLLGKALLLLEKCNETDKTFSFERESKIGEIKKLLDDNGRA